MDARHQKVAEEKNLNIEMDPEIAKIYQASTAVSVSKGTSHNMMKATAKRRRGKAQIEEEKREQARRLQETEDKLARFAKLEKQVLDLQAKASNVTLMEETMQHLLDGSFIK